MENRTRSKARIAIIPSALRAARLRKFWEPEDLAKAASVGVGTIKAAEGREKTVHLSTARRLADALGCEPSDIARVKTEEEVA